MPNVTQEQLAQEVHAAGTRLVIALTGGGTGAIPALVGVPGASRSILAAAVPYAAPALAEWLGGKPDEFCSQRTARAMAMVAYMKAQTYDPPSVTCGAACTASLVSDRPKRGSHRAHLAWQSAGTTSTVSVELEKGRRTRAEEEAVVAALVLNLVAEACGVPGRLAVPLGENEQLQTARIVAPLDQQELLAGRVAAISLGPQNARKKPPALLPGAFNPLHEGHQTMARLASQILGVDVAFEISILNVDKPPLDFVEIDRRTRQFAADQTLWLSRASLFSQKAELFPGATFVVGADTIARIGDPRYYAGQEAVMNTALAQIASAGCSFLVFGRQLDGKFRTLSELHVPEPLARLCQEVPASVFRVDRSSTQIRAATQAP